jgi:hypothetical protein
MDKHARLVGFLALAFAVVASTAIAARSWVSVKTRRVDTIEVTGSAKRRILSDLIVWEAAIATSGTDRTEAYKALHVHVDKTIAYLKAQGLSDKEIRVGSVVTTEIVDTEYVGTGEDRVAREVHRGWTTTQQIGVQSNQVELVERVSREVTQLIEAGVPIRSDAPAYFYTKLGELKIEMLAEASKDARVRAQRMLESAGGAKLGRLVNADMGVININPANSTTGSWDGNNDTRSLEKDIITIVHVTYEL